MFRLLPMAAALAAWVLMGCSSTTDPAPVEATNVALQGTVSASAVWENNPSLGPEKAIDGSSYDDSGTVNYWLLPNQTAGWWQVDLGWDVDIHSIDLYNTNNGSANDRATKDFRLEIQDSSRTVVFSHAGVLPFTSRSSATHPTAAYTVKPEKAKAGRYVKVYVDSWYPTRSDPSWPHPVVSSGTASNEGGGLNEVRVFGKPGP